MSFVVAAVADLIVVQAETFVRNNPKSACIG